MTGRALGSVEHPNWGTSEAEKSTKVYDFRTDTWTDSGDLLGGPETGKELEQRVLRRSRPHCGLWTQRRIRPRWCWKSLFPVALQRGLPGMVCAHPNCDCGQLCRL
jgi:hypothetical protein